MKKIIFTIAIVITMICSADAQDRFFDGGGDDGYRNNEISPTSLLLPQGGVGVRTDDQPAGAPLGSGLLILTALGAGYAVSRRKN